MKNSKIILISICIGFVIFWIFLKPPSPFNFFWVSLYATLFGTNNIITEGQFMYFFDILTAIIIIYGTFIYFKKKATKIVIHSLGGAYDKGFARAILDYAIAHSIAGCKYSL